MAAIFIAIGGQKSKKVTFLKKHKNLNVLNIRFLHFIIFR